MQQESFEVLSKAKNREEIRSIEPIAQKVCAKYMWELEDADVRELAIH